MVVGDDFKVRRRHREDVADIASSWRRAGGTTANNWFDVVSMLENVVLPSLARQGLEIAVRIVEDDPAEAEGWVDIAKGEVCFQNWVWEAALAHHPHGRLVVAHEIGHLVLHGDQLHGFSPIDAVKLGFLDPAESVECQANWFASSLLLPDEVLLKLSALSNASVATLAIVSERVVEVRRRELALDKRYRRYTGDECHECGSARMAIRGSRIVCEDCGSSAVESRISGAQTT